MRNGHDRFEALAGAIALGEATSGERLLFDAHARTCAACREDAETGPLVRSFVETARETESWRPAIRESVFARIHGRRSVTSRFAIGALGWAFAGSVLLNAAIVSGVAGHVDRAWRDRAPASDVVATRIEIERRKAAAAPTPVPAYVVPSMHAAARRPLPHAVAIHRRAPSQRTASTVRSVAPVATLASPPDRAVDANIDDVLAGLDLASGHGLAAATALRCADRTDVFGAHEHCATGHDDAQVPGDARVPDDARVRDDARVP